MSAEALLEQTKEYIASADEGDLYALEMFLSSRTPPEEQKDWWLDTPKEVQDLLLRAMEEPREEGIPHEEMKKRYPQWFKKGNLENRCPDLA